MFHLLVPVCPTSIPPTHTSRYASIPFICSLSVLYTFQLNTSKIKETVLSLRMFTFTVYLHESLLCQRKVTLVYNTMVPLPWYCYHGTVAAPHEKSSPSSNHCVSNKGKRHTPTNHHKHIVSSAQQSLLFSTARTYFCFQNTPPHFYSSQTRHF